MTVEYVASGGYYSHAHAPVYQSTTVPLWFKDHTRSLWNVIPPNSAEIQCVFLWFHFKNLIESFANEDIFLHVYILCWCWIRLLLFIQSLWTNKYWLWKFCVHLYFREMYLQDHIRGLVLWHCDFKSITCSLFWTLN